MADSELILNADGSVYHLGLLPEHVAPLIITVGDPDRVARVSAHFESVDYRLRRREFVTHGGRFAGRRLLCLSTGIGTDNVDIALNELDALANVDLATGAPRERIERLTIVRLGTSGTFQADIAVDTVLASASAVGLDGLGPFYGFSPGPEELALRRAYPDFAAAAYSARADRGLLESWREANPEAQLGCTLTCAGFYGPQRRSIRLPFLGPSLTQLGDLRFNYGGEAGTGRLTNFEMETAGLYGLAALLGHRALSLSAILANRATGIFSARADETVEEMIVDFFEQLRLAPEQWWGA